MWEEVDVTNGLDEPNLTLEQFVTGTGVNNVYERGIVLSEKRAWVILEQGSSRVQTYQFNVSLV